MKNKEFVLTKYPRAYAYKWAGNNSWTIYATRPYDPGHIGYSLSHSGRTAAESWKFAADKIKSNLV